MTEINIEKKQEEYLNRIKSLHTEIDSDEEKYREVRKSKRDQLAELMREAKLESDLSLATIANRLGRSRQSVNNVMIEKYGIRYPDKAKAASLGHKKGINGETSENQ